MLIQVEKFPRMTLERLRRRFLCERRAFTTKGTDATVNRKQKRAQERAEAKAAAKVEAFRKTSLLAEDVHQRAWQEGFKKGERFATKAFYAASCVALHRLYGFHAVRLKRFLLAVEDIVLHSLTTEEAMDAALREGGIKINLVETFPEDRIEEVRHD